MGDQSMPTVDEAVGTAQKWLKPAFFISLLGAAAYFILPKLAIIAWNLVSVLVAGVVGLGIIIMLPAISEILAQLSYRLWEMAIRGDPIARVKRDLAAHAKQIEEMEDNIGTAQAQTISLQNLLRDERRNMDPDQIENWQGQISMLIDAGKKLLVRRDAEVVKHEDFQRIVKKAEADMRLGNAFASTLKVFKSGENSGADSAGARVALDQVQKQLAESQAKLQVVLSRKLTIDIKKPLELSAPSNTGEVIINPKQYVTNRR